MGRVRCADRTFAFPTLYLAGCYAQNLESSIALRPDHQYGTGVGKDIRQSGDVDLMGDQYQRRAGALFADKPAQLGGYPIPGRITTGRITTNARPCGRARFRVRPTTGSSRYLVRRRVGLQRRDSACTLWEVTPWIVLILYRKSSLHNFGTTAPVRARFIERLSP